MSSDEIGFDQEFDLNPGPQTYHEQTGKVGLGNFDPAAHANENPGALAGATGAGSIELAFRSTDYRMRAEAATSLCLAIANCAPQDAVIVMAAALADLVGQVVA